MTDRTVCTFRCGIFIEHPTLSPEAGVSPAGAAPSVREISCKTDLYCIVDTEQLKTQP